jgi:leucyl/phenylalanyl-tRNA--protein transferase
VSVEPDPTPWVFPDQLDPDDDLVALGADLAPGTLLDAYRRGLFPMPGPVPDGPPYWFSPISRGVLPVRGLRVSRSLRRARQLFEIRVDSAFDEVVGACADPSRPRGWIDCSVQAAYGELHRLGWAHSVEAWQDGELVGGLYGVAVGGLFAGESMFHRRTDASKVALCALVEMLQDEHADQRLLDVQWVTPHLASLGAVEISREEYRCRLARALPLPPPAGLRG